MSGGTALLLLVILACPLLMLFMHRGGGHAHGSSGGHAHGSSDGSAGGHGGHGGHESGTGELSIDELRRRRDELDAAIRERESPQR